ncbi:MAG: hypothetical protein O3A87_06335 [Verrucomicrobia bacterium]|nr:hypothetical protein [Verrucomicrobiota bacterium]MDA1006084.1 hypothetical protein [Verrucomicrobiota bacterium]
MLQSLMGRVPRGTGDGGVGGAGSGSGGSGGDGFSVAGDSTNVPMYGPDRLSFSKSSGLSGRDGSSGPTSRPGPEEQPRSQINPELPRDAEHAKLSSESIPAKYRDAVKRYFTRDEESQPPAP